MCLFPRTIKHPFSVAVQRSHDADPREHRWPAGRSDQDQDFHCSLPFRRCVLDRRKSRDVVAGVLKGGQRATAGQGIGSSKMRDQAINALSQIQAHRSGGPDITWSAASRNDRSASAR